MMIKKKRGILLNNALTTIIAVIGLVLIFFAAYKLYQTFVNQEAENAKNALNVIEAKINNLNDGETGKFLVQGTKGWFLVGWSKEEVNRPDKCFFESCICVCKGNIGKNTEFIDQQFKDLCQNNGFCRDSKKEEIVLRGKKEQLTTGIIPVGKPLPYTLGFIRLPENLIELKISKTERSLEIEDARLEDENK